MEGVDGGFKSTEDGGFADAGTSSYGDGDFDGEG